MSRTRILVALLLAAAATGGVTAWLLLRGGSKALSPPIGKLIARSSADPRLEIALSDDEVFLDRAYYDRDAAFQQSRQIGVSWLRVIVGWAKVLGTDSSNPVAPDVPQYDWSAFDDLIAAAGAQGVKVELTLAGPAPAFATGDRKVGPVEPDAGLFAAFALAAADHFRGRVTRYSIWNEPNYVSWISPLRRGAQIYRALYRRGYDAIKSVDPHAQVLIGETAPYAQPGRATAPLAFLRGLTCAGIDFRPVRRCARLRADGYAHHPYDFTRPPEQARPGRDNVTLGGLERLLGPLDRLGRTRALATPSGRRLDLYLTEFGYFRTGKRALPEDKRAAYLQRAFQIAARLARVRQMLQYLLVAPPKDAPNAFFDTAILTLAGEPEKTFVSLAAFVREAVRRGRIVVPAGA